MMKNGFIVKKELIFISFFLFLGSAFADNNCFIAMEGGKVIKEKGACDERHSPYSSFKIAIALMGFESKIFQDVNHPLVPFTPEVIKRPESQFNYEKYPSTILHARAQTPTSWMKYSVVWYSQYVTRKLGMQEFQKYIDLFDYGNKDLKGDEEHQQGLENAWLGTSLSISPREQAIFVTKLRQKSLPVSIAAQRNTIQIMKLCPLFDNWQLYGKTGGPVNKGWFVGWVEKKGRVISFAQYIEKPADSLLTGGRVAKEVAIDNLTYLIAGPT